MAHHIYHTRGVILGSGPSGESNRYFKIFTEELGLIVATAQAVREGKSKLRYVLQDLSLVLVDLVRGKEIWRITSAIESEPRDFMGGEDQRKLFARICATTARFLQGEGNERDLFSDLYTLFDFLKHNEISRELYSPLETLAALRCLYLLGYIDAAGYETFLTPGSYSVALAESFDRVRGGAALLITKAITSSHL